MYVTVKVTWIILGAGAILTALFAWRYPKSVVPITIGIAAAALLASIMHL